MDQAERPVYRTNLESLHWFIRISLTTLSQRVDAAGLNANHLAGLHAALDDIRNTFDMVAEIALVHEVTLHDVACLLNSLADAGRMDPAGLEEVFDEYTDNLGALAADRLIAQALRT